MSANFDLARAYLIALPPAVSGAGGHAATFKAACALAQFGLSQSEAWTLLCEYNTRCVPPWSEGQLKHKLAGAFHAARPEVRLTNSTSPARPCVPITKISFEPEKLMSIAAKGPQPTNWRHWLWERSPKRPETQNALSFLKHLFRPGEKVLVFDVFESKKPAWTIPISDPMDCRVPAAMRDGGHGAGIWFLSNPVDGQWHPNPRQDNALSCRSQEAVTSFRYVVLESDNTPAHQWLGLLAQLPMRVGAVYTSGGRSIHALVRVDAGSKTEWDSAIAPLKRPLKVLGADYGSLTAVRLTRLPGCRRPEKHGFQRLLYLNPEPPDTPMMNLPIRCTRAESLMRWKQICPRWNPGMEAA